MKKFKIDYTFYLSILIFYLAGYKNFILPYLISLFFHELGHILALKLWGYKIERIELYFFGGILKTNFHKNNKNYMQIVIYTLGVVFNGILFFIPYYPFKILNTSMMIMNLLPIFPLDGYYILEGILSYFFRYKSVLKIMKWVYFMMLCVISYYLITHFSYAVLFYLVLLVLQINQYKLSKKYEDFLLDKYLHPNLCLSNKELNIKEIGLLNNFKKGFNNIYYNGSDYISEEELLNKKFRK